MYRCGNKSVNPKTITTPKLLAAGILALSFLLSLAIIHVEAAASDSSITFKKGLGSELFTLTIRDPDGIQEFSLSLVGRYVYGGGLSGCPKSFSSDYLSFIDPDDFTPVMPAYIIDCKNNKAEFEIPPPVNGVTRSVAVKKEVPPPPSPPPPEEEKKEEKKQGPLAAQDIQYPVSDLGNCQNETECRSYCDNAEHAKECLAFAKKYNLISEEEAQKAADQFLNVKNGPGGCSSGESCEEYCNNVDHLDECITFAEETGYYSPVELAEARKFQALIKGGKQFPGGCKDRNTCELYCNVPDHMEECLNFAEETGFLPKEEIEQARKILPLMKSGETPGKCNSKEQCEKYCAAEENLDECIAFADKAGLLSEEEREMIKKTGGKGPGGCRSREQCEAYCEDNGEECFRFAQEHGLMSEADLERMREGMEQFKENLDKMPPEAVACMKDAAGEENFNKMLAGEPVFDRSLEEKMKSCFSQITSQLSGQLNTLPPEAAQCIKDTIGEEGLKKLQSGEFAEDIDFSSLEVCFQQIQTSFGGGSGGPGGPGGFSGPGGCQSIDECTAYCQDNPEECQNFGPPGSSGGGGFQGGPGGCTSPEECTAYCEEHPDECGSFGGGTTGGEFPIPPSGGVQPPSDGYEGPGGCTSPEECIAYCTAHYTDPACASYVGDGGGGGGGGGPGGCQSPEECQAYCQEHPQECGGGGDQPPPPSTQSCAPVPSGLVSWSAEGGATYVPGKVGNAFKFNGNESINMGNQTLLNFGTGPFSLEAWFNWDGSGSSKGNIIRKSNYPVRGDGAGYWLVIGKENSMLEFFTGETVGNTGKARGSVSAPISSGVWYYVAATRNSNGTMSLYIDGQLKGTAEAANANTTSEAPFTLGAWDDRFGVTEFFSGLIDEISVYNRALGASEIQAIFNAGSNGKCSAYSSGGLVPEPSIGIEPASTGSEPAPTPTTNYSGPGGCTTPEECKTYCTKNYQDPACQQFMPYNQPSPSSPLSPSSLLGTILGPWLLLLK